MRRDLERNNTAVRGFIVGISVILGVAVIAFGWGSLESVASRRNALRIVEGKNCVQIDSCTYESLNAATRSANAAEDMFDLAVWQILLGAAGVYLVARTLKATREAVIEANEATQTARDAVRITVESMQRQLRAYVVVDIGQLQNHEEKGRPKAAVIVRNVGQTPAYNVSTLMVVELVSAGQTAHVPDYKDVVRQQLVIGTGLNKTSRREADFSLTTGGIEALHNRKGFILVAGCTVYEDVFGNTWWTQFCHLFSGPNMEGTYHTELNRAV